MTRSSNKSTARSTGALVLFCTGFTLYFLYVKINTFGFCIPKVFYCGLMTWFIRFVVSEAKKGYDSFLHKNIMQVCEYAIYLNFMVIMFNYLGIINSVYIIIPTFNGLISFILCNFFFIAYRKGYFTSKTA